MLAKGVDTDLATVERDMQARDDRDTARATAPMQAAPDAVVLDTTELDADAAFALGLQAVRARLGN